MEDGVKYKKRGAYLDDLSPPDEMLIVPDLKDPRYWAEQERKNKQASRMLKAMGQALQEDRR